MVHVIVVITDEERKAFMKGFPDRKRKELVSDRTDDSKGGDEEKFFVEKVIKMHVNKKGKEEFLVKWVGYPMNEATWKPFENLSSEEACEYLAYNQITCLHKNWLTFLFQDEEAMAMKKGKQRQPHLR
jgi:hypothetical protein